MSGVVRREPESQGLKWGPEQTPRGPDPVPQILWQLAEPWQGLGSRQAASADMAVRVS